MSVVDASLFAKIKGSFGNVVVYEVNGQMRIRQKPGKYKKSKSTKQKAQKNKFKAAANFYTKVGIPMLYTWDEATRGKTMSGYNLFIKENIHHFSDTGEITSYAGLKVCCGPLFIPEEFEMQYALPGRVHLEWPTEYEGEGYDSDLLQVAVYDKSKMKGSPVYWLEEAEASRSEGACDFLLPEKGGDEIHLFVFFRSKFQNIFSDSRFAGTVTREK